MSVWSNSTNLSCMMDTKDFDTPTPDTPANSATLPQDETSKRDRRYDSRAGADFFLEVSKSLRPVTDKVTDHSYYTMYGQFLLPYVRDNPNLKFLEIGLGCNMKYGPGASVNLWNKLLPNAEIWEAEFYANCVKKAVKNGMLDGIRTLTGDQGNVTVLDGWIEQSGGNFDVIVDDGGHDTCQIWTSFLKLWPELKSGGLYFIEDLHVANLRKYKRVESPLCSKDVNILNKLGDVNKSLLKGGKNKDDFGYTDVKFLYCQQEACVIGKK